MGPPVLDNRKYSLDLLRIIAAFGIIVIHVSYQSYVLLNTIGYQKWIITKALGWSFIWGTPSFLMISGYLLLTSSSSLKPLDFFRKRAGKLLIPYTFWNLFYFWLKYRPTFGSFNLHKFLSEILGSGTYYHLFFLNAIIGLYLLTPLIRKFVSYNSLKMVVPLLLVLSTIYHYGSTFWGWRHINSVFLWFLPFLGYYLTGWWLSQIKFNHNIKWIILVPILVTILSILISRKLVFEYNDYDQGRILVNRLSVTTMISAIFLFQFFVNINITQTVFKNILIFLSDKSLGVYLIHPFFIFIIQQLWFIPKLILNHYWIYLSTMIFGTFFCSILAVYAIKKIPVIGRIV